MVRYRASLELSHIAQPYLPYASYYVLLYYTRGPQYDLYLVLNCPE
jgi:hypothetical protein